MTLVLSLAVGALFAAAIYCMLSRSTVRLALGLVLLGSATNLLLFTVNGLRRAHPPLIPEGAQVLRPPYSDPLPQAFMLTSIVINFGLLGLLLVLVHRTEQEVGTDDTRALRAELPDPEK